MIRSMFSAISGLRNHQVMMDVVGNNIANVNTTGFKSSAVVFQDVLSQSLRGAGQPSDELGGTNPAVVGLGSKVAAVTTNYSQGALQRTGRATDVAIQGDGFFIVDQAGLTNYTRAGSFSVDALGRLVTQEGGLIQGWSATNGVVNSNATPKELSIPIGSLIAPVTTTELTYGGNLPAIAPVVTSAIPANGAGPIPTPAAAEPAGSTVTTSVDIFDDRGNKVPLTLTWYKTSSPAAVPSTWEVRATVPDPTTAGQVVVVNLPVSQVTFGADGERITPALATSLVVPRAQLQTAGYPAFTTVPTADIVVNLGEPGATPRLTGFGNTNSAAALIQDGSAAGFLQSFGISQEGLIVGNYSNGRTQVIGQLATAVFANPEGLESVGGSNFRASVNSGLAQVGLAGSGGRGLLSAATLEMSNVDLSQEFTNLIVSQRGFQANSRVISTSDELLQEIVNLRR
jgi:flagellar hook protein FlgE